MIASHAPDGCKVGTCPLCGNEISEDFSSSPSGLQCWRCGYLIWCCKRMVGDVVILDVIVGSGHEPEDLRDMFGQLLDFDAVHRVVVNLSRIDCLDSGFMAGLIGLKRRLQSTGGRLILCGLGPVVQEIFNATQLHTFFEIADGEREAFEALQSNALEQAD